MNGPFCLVVNPAAGGGRSLSVVPQVTAALDGAGGACEVSRSASLEHARELAGRAARLGQVVVAVGGDGLTGALAGTVASAGGRLGLIPAGRGNDLARVLGIPSDPEAAAAVLADGGQRQVDLIAASVPGQPEMIVAGSVYFGVPAVAGQIANQARWPRGPARYPAAGLRALARWSPARFRVSVRRPSGEEVSEEFAGCAAVVANSAFFGAGMKVAPDAQMDDGILDALVMRTSSRLAFIRVLARIRNGSHLTLRQIGADRGTEVTVTANRAVLAGADGETLPCAAPLPTGVPLRIRVLPGALRVLAPRDAGGPLAEPPGPPIAS